MLIAGNDAQKKKYLGRLIEEPLLAVSSVINSLKFKVIFKKLYAHLVWMFLWEEKS